MAQDPAAHRPLGSRQKFLRDKEHERQFDEGRPKLNQALAAAIKTVRCATGYNDAGADEDGTIHMEAGRLMYSPKVLEYDDFGVRSSLGGDDRGPSTLL
jgi:hypothetical protein